MHKIKITTLALVVSFIALLGLLGSCGSESETDRVSKQLNSSTSKINELSSEVCRHKTTLAEGKLTDALVLYAHQWRRGANDSIYVDTIDAVSKYPTPLGLAATLNAKCDAIVQVTTSLRDELMLNKRTN